MISQLRRRLFAVYFFIFFLLGVGAPLGVEAQTATLQELQPLTQEQYKKLVAQDVRRDLLLQKSIISLGVIGIMCFALLFMALFKQSKLFSRDRAFVAAWALVRKYRWSLMALFFAQQLVQTAASIAYQYRITPFFPENLAAQIFIGQLIAVLIGTFIMATIIRILLAISAGSFNGLKTVFQYLPSPRTFFSAIGGFILYILCTALGILLLVVPAFIIAVVFGFFYIIIVDTGAGPIVALRRSAQLTKGCRVDLFLLAVLCVALNVAGALVFMFGLLITLPLTFLVFIDVYRQLSANPAPAQQPVSSHPLNKPRTKTSSGE